MAQVQKVPLRNALRKKASSLMSQVLQLAALRDQLVPRGAQFAAQYIVKHHDVQVPGFAI